MNSTILVVDDDLNLQETLRAILEDAGYRVVVADDGLTALEALQTVQPGLILLDIGLPQMDGYAFASALEQRGLRPLVPVMVLTADGRAREKAERVGAEGYLAKPFGVTSLLDEVARLLHQSAA